jgi:hypothetical protein
MRTSPDTTGASVDQSPAAGIMTTRTPGPWCSHRRGSYRGLQDDRCTRGAGVGSAVEGCVLARSTTRSHHLGALLRARTRAHRVRPPSGGVRCWRSNSDHARSALTPVLSCGDYDTRERSLCRALSVVGAEVSGTPACGRQRLKTAETRPIVPRSGARLPMFR